MKTPKSQDNHSQQAKPSELGTGNSIKYPVLDKTRNSLSRAVNLRDNTVDAIFEMLHLLDDKVTKINNRFSNLSKELGYKV